MKTKSIKKHDHFLNLLTFLSLTATFMLLGVVYYKMYSASDGNKALPTVQYIQPASQQESEEEQETIPLETI